MITYHVGDATEPDLPGRLAIAHVLSDAGAYGKGFAAAVAARHPAAHDRFKAWARGDAKASGTARPFRLGAIQWVGVGHDLGRTYSFGDRWVVNMVAMHGLRSGDNPVPLDYDALDWCLTQLGATTQDESIVMPRIGCHLAGGTWDRVGPLVEKRLHRLDVHVYDLAQPVGVAFS